MYIIMYARWFKVGFEVSTQDLTLKFADATCFCAFESVHFLLQNVKKSCALNFFKSLYFINLALSFPHSEILRIQIDVTLLTLYADSSFVWCSFLDAHAMLQGCFVYSS